MAEAALAEEVLWADFEERTNSAKRPCHSGTLFFPNELKEKLLQFGKNLLTFCPYGYSKEKCILPSCS